MVNIPLFVGFEDPPFGGLSDVATIHSNDMGNMEGNMEAKIMMDLVVSTLGQRKPRLPPTLNDGETWLNHVKPA
jgi:hypothetical protein